MTNDAIMNRMKIEYSSDLDSEFIVADVYLDSKYFLMMYVMSPEDEVHIGVRFSSHSDVVDPFVGELSVNELMELISEARRRYVERLTIGPNPFA